MISLQYTVYLEEFILHYFFTQDISHYVFNPDVLTVNQIYASGINTSFYLTGTGVGRSKEIFVETLTGKV